MMMICSLYCIVNSEILCKGFIFMKPCGSEVSKINTHEMAKSLCSKSCSSREYFYTVNMSFNVIHENKILRNFPNLQSGITILFLMIHVPYHEVISGYVYNTAL